MRLSDFGVLTFDCYGTLVDWEAGIWRALAPLVEAAAAADVPGANAGRMEQAPGREAALLAFAGHETAQQAATPAMPYRDVLAAVYRRLAADWDVPATDPTADGRAAAAFAAALADWPPFPDTVAALRALKRHYRLVILSNVDRASFRATDAALGVGFDAIYTAEDIGSYKPDPANFRYAIDHIRADFGLGPADILHTAQSLFHDHLPARALGLASAWIRRPGAVMGHSGAQAVPARPPVDFAFDTLGDMAAARAAEA